MTGIQEALARVKSAIGAVGKNEKNTMQNFNFRGVDAVVNAAAPHLNAEGVITLPHVEDYTYETVEVGKNRTPMGHALLTVRYTFVGPDGSSLVAQVMSEAMDSGDKAIAKAMSVAYRIALLQVLNLPTMDPDPDLDSYDRSGGNGEIAKKEKTAISGDFAKLAKNAKSVGELREVWKQAGAAGALQTTYDWNGKRTVLQDILYLRNDALAEDDAQKSLKDAGLV